MKEKLLGLLIKVDQVKINFETSVPIRIYTFTASCKLGPQRVFEKNGRWTIFEKRKTVKAINFTLLCCPSVMKRSKKLLYIGTPKCQGQEPRGKGPRFWALCQGFTGLGQKLPGTDSSLPGPTVNLPGPGLSLPGPGSGLPGPGSGLPGPKSGFLGLA